jgi:Domain of unknown function (DUF6919)
VNRHDRRHWASAGCLADLGELTAQWCEGHLTQTPGHAGPPAAETLPYLDLLATVNRAGFVTENSQAAKPGRTAWVCGFADSATTGWLLSDAAGAGLTGKGLEPWVQKEIRYWYLRYCPRARSAIQAARLIWIEDPEPGRNNRLWPVLAAFASRSSHV